MAARQLSDGGEDGTVLGQSADDLVGFHGVPPTDQAAYVANVSTTTAKAISAGYGFKTTAQFTALIAAVNSLLTMAREKGFLASS